MHDTIKPDPREEAEKIARELRDMALDIYAGVCRADTSHEAINFIVSNLLTAQDAAIERCAQGVEQTGATTEIERSALRKSSREWAKGRQTGIDEALAAVRSLKSPEAKP